MSLSSIILAFAPAIAARLKVAEGREQQAHMKVRRSLWPALDGSAGELAEAKAEIADLKIDLADARRDVAMWRDRARAYDEALRRANDAPRQPPQPAGPDFRPPDIARAQAMLAQYAAAQMNVQAAMQAQNFYNGAQFGNSQLGQGLHGAQSAFGFADVCNCVPARHDMFLRG